MHWGRFLSRIPRAQRRPLALFALLFAVVLLLLALNFLALKIESGARAYATGNSLWASAQKDAVFYLERYAESGDPSDWQDFKARLEVPLGDRNARLALDRDPPDILAARRGFRAGDNAAADIPMLIRLYRYFSWEPHFQRAITIWRNADTYILDLQHIGDEIFAARNAQPDQHGRIHQLVQRARAINVAVRPLEDRFAAAVGTTGRWITEVLLVTCIGISAIVFILGAYLMRRMTAATFEAEARFRATFEHAALGIAHVSLDGCWLSMNRRMADILGERRASLIGRSFAESTHPDDAGRSEAVMRDLIDGDETALQLHKRYLRPDGSVVWANINTTLLRDIDDEPLYYITVVEDVTEQHRLAEELSHQARHDALTGLINRAEFEKRLEAAIDNARIDNDHGALCFLDLDRFKIVNDSCGHLAGDALLQQIANVIRDNVRSNDTLGRLGGDEFGLLLQSCPADAAQAVADKVRSAVENFRFIWNGETYRLGASIGVAMFDNRTTDVDALIHTADEACYEVKAAGRNHVRMARAPCQGAGPEHGDRAGGLRAALEEGRCLLMWQPVALATRSSPPWRHVEVLVRMREEDGRILAPMHFLPLAQRQGLSEALDRWVVTTALAQLATSAALRDSLECISINLSESTLGNQALATELADLITASEMDAHQIRFEISEQAAVANMVATRDFMDVLTSAGCSFALDDFGGSSASYRYVASLPVTEVKFDDLVTRDVDTDPVHETVAGALNEIAHAMGRSTVAKRVERTPVLARLRRLGIDRVQGHAICQPMLFADLAATLDRPAQISN